jgi:hypothetical protein
VLGAGVGALAYQAVRGERPAAPRTDTGSISSGAGAQGPKRTVV